MVMVHHEMLHFVVGSLLLHVGSSINVETLSILEYSITESESTKCDLVVFGNDLRLDEENELQRPLILSFHGSTDAEHATRKSLNLLAKCVILFMSEEVYSINEMIHLARKLQYIKPVGVVYEVKKDWSILAEDIEHQSWPFPIIFQHVNGKYDKASISKSCNLVLFQVTTTSFAQVFLRSLLC